MRETYVERDLEKKLNKYLKRKEILAIVGTRQSGKTTLMRHLFKKLKNAKFITFEDREVLDIFLHDTNLFVKKFAENTDFLFIDEFQYAKEGGKKLKQIYDLSHTKIIISGSSAVELSVQSIKFLVGRILVFTLNPFSFNEFLRHKDPSLWEVLSQKKLSDVSIRMINKALEDYLAYGGYPAVVLSKTEQEKKEVLRNIFNIYLLREIKEILQISEDYKISKLIKAVSLQVGSTINYDELSSITGFEYYELMKYLNILKKTFIIIESRPFFTNKRKELVKAPKLYFLDNGFRNIAINNFASIDSRVDKGSLNENFVASELFKAGHELHYWKTKAGAEVDFVIEENSKAIPFEVKSTLKGIKYTRSFKNFVGEYKPQKAFVLSKNLFKKTKIGKTNILFAPAFLTAQLIGN